MKVPTNIWYHIQDDINTQRIPIVTDEKDLPDGDVVDGEEVMGEMNELEKQMFSVSLYYHNYARSLASDFVKIREAISEEDKQYIHNELHFCTGMAEQVGELMWFNIRGRFKMLCDDEWNAGIRKGWKVVRSKIKSDEKDPIKSPLKSLGSVIKDINKNRAMETISDIAKKTIGTRTLDPKDMN